MLGTVVYQLIINGKLAKLTENITLLQREIGCQDTFCMEQNFKKSLCKKKKKKKKIFFKKKKKKKKKEEECQNTSTF